MTMDKLIKLTVTVLMAVLYFPVILFSTVYVYVLGAVARRNGEHVVSYTNVDEVYTKTPRKEVMIRDYSVINLPTTSLIGVGVVFTTYSRKTIYTGSEFNRFSKELQTYIILHEMGHHEHPRGMTSTKLPWNPEDRLSPLPTGVIAEVAADEYALANGADKYKWVITKFLAKNLLVSPINMIIRIIHVWRYKA